MDINMEDTVSFIQGNIKKIQFQLRSPVCGKYSVPDEGSYQVMCGGAFLSLE